MSKDDTEINLLIKKYLFLDNFIMRIILLAASFGSVAACFLITFPLLDKILPPGDKRFVVAVPFTIVGTWLVFYLLTGLIGKFIFHSVIKIKCKKCSTVNTGDVEYCVKCDYRIQDFKSNDIFIN